MEGYSFNSLQAAPGSALAGNSSSLLVQQQQQQPTSLISQQYYYEYHHQQQPQPQPTQHQQPNSTDYLFATSQNSPSIYYTSVDSTQALNSYNTDFTTNSFTAAVSNNNNNNTNNNVIYTQTAPVADFQPSTIVPESFDFGGGNFLFEESSVFLSPQTQSSAASSASQSPESKSQYFALSGNAATTLATDSLDLSLEELLQNIGSEEDNIFGSIGVEDDLALSDELFEALKDVAEGEEGEEDFFSELNFEDAGQLGLLSQGGSSNTATLEISSSSISSNSSVCSASSDFFLNASFSSSSSTSSVSSTPKRKYSSDSSSSSSSSSTYCYSEASYQTAASTSSSGSSEPEIEPTTAAAKQSKPASSSSNNKRARRAPKASPVEKAARKKDQNKRAACRYRSKKRTELHSSELTMEELEAVRDGLAEQVRKLQTEFGVILPLARAAFAHDAAKRARLQAMLARVDGLL
ncbi:hypothetical protein TYRP_013889 [Tyrophagus putrescentiae]|nr:hypothetical protein TYRP_013889 [Tyrophagus putrescentiae]